MTITLPPEVESALTEQACRRGMTPESLAVDSLRERFIPPVPAHDPVCRNLGRLLRWPCRNFGVRRVYPGRGQHVG